MKARTAFSLGGSLALMSIPLLCGGCSLTLALDPNQGQNAAVARGSATESSTATLVRLLESDDPQVRSVAVRGLADMGESARAAAPALHGMVDDPDLHVRYEAAKALAAVHPDDPALPAVLVLMANDNRLPEEQRTEMRSMLQRVNPMLAYTSSEEQRLESEVGVGVESAESVDTGTMPTAPTTRPATPDLSESSATPTTRPIMASERPEQSAESARSGANAVEVPKEEKATAPTTRPVERTELSEIPGLAGLAIGNDAPPAPDISLFGHKSYTSAGALQVKNWIERQASLSDQEQQARVKEFQDWRYGQDKLIYQKVLEK